MVAAALRQTTPGDVVNIDYWPIGGARDLWYAKERQVLIEGPAGTGKTVACLNKLHRMMTKYPGARALMVRKTQVSLKASALVTYQRKVLHPLDGVRFYGGSQAEPAKFIYPNGSEVIVGGMDQASKVMSTEYDVAYVNEATDLTEDDWESIDTRLRNYVIPYQQLIADCNPQAPNHWLNVRCDAGKTRRILSRHEDNPFYFDPKTGDLTHEGRDYISGLDNLSGVRYQRLRLGKWVAAEGQVLDAFDRSVHVITRDQLEALGFGSPASHIAGVDWGYTNPGSIEIHAVGSDRRLCLVEEIYQTRKTQDWWVEQAISVRDRYGVEVFVCDPSEPAYIAAFIAAGLVAIPAQNAILPGITAFQQRLTVQDDGRPRYYVLADANASPDPALIADHKPTGFLDEVDAYVWGASGRLGKEKPVDDANHAIDPCRYVVMFMDGAPESDEAATVVYDDPVSISTY